MFLAYRRFSFEDAQDGFNTAPRGHLGPSWGLLGPSWGLFGTPWERPVASLGRLGGLLGASFGPSRGILANAKRRCAVLFDLKAVLMRLGAILGPLGTALGPSWGRLGAVLKRPGAQLGLIFDPARANPSFHIAFLRPMSRQAPSKSQKHGAAVNRRRRLQSAAPCPKARSMAF